MIGCATVAGTPALVRDSVKIVCFTNAQLAALTREQKVALAQNNDLTGKRC
jgi:hypothetical protein